MISTKKDGSIAAFIQEQNQHIRRQENQICTDKEELKKAFTKIKELQEELKTTREDYLEEINALVGKIDDLENKIGHSWEIQCQKQKSTNALVRITTSSSTTPTRNQVKMTLLMKLEQISWSLRLIKISSRPPYQ